MGQLAITTSPPLKMLPAPYIPPTLSVAQAYQAAYDYFNESLFEPVFSEKLPHVILNLSRKGRGHTIAFFAPGRWKAIKDGTEIAEISLVPEHTNRPLKDVFATLCHEMAHFKDELDGTSCKNGYHGNAWFKLMARIGLPGEMNNGSRTSVHHSIAPGGPFEVAFEKMPGHIRLPFVGTASYRKPKNPDSKQGARFKYTCPSCGDNVRGKYGLHLKCLTCDEILHNDGL